jgi:hypothetical protein
MLLLLVLLLLLLLLPLLLRSLHLSLCAISSHVCDVCSIEVTPMKPRMVVSVMIMLHI